MVQSQSSLDALVLAARELQAAGTTDGLLSQIVSMAVKSVDGCTYAGVSTDRHGRLDSPVVSDPNVYEIDVLQYETNTGPCVEAMRGPTTAVDAPDLENDARFQPFGAAAAAMGCRSMHAQRLYVDSQTLGSLNLYGSEPDAFTDGDRKRAAILSALASLALNMARLEIDGEGLREAVQSRDVIGQAKGILMQRDRLNADEAFAWLRDESQRRNVKLRDIAQQIVDDRAS